MHWYIALALHTLYALVPLHTLYAFVHTLLHAFVHTTTHVSCLGCTMRNSTLHRVQLHPKKMSFVHNFSPVTQILFDLQVETYSACSRGTKIYS